MPTPYNRRYVPYRDLGSYFAQPATGKPASAAWFRQAAHNLSMITNITNIGPYSPVSGTIAYDPGMAGPTGTSTGGYVRVGQMCFVFIGASISNLGSEGCTFTLPIQPGSTIVPMHAGTGYVFDGTSSELPVVAEIQDDLIQVYYTASSASDGRLIQADPLTFVAGGELHLYVSYRVAPAPDGYLSDLTYIVEHQATPA